MPNMVRSHAKIRYFHFWIWLGLMYLLPVCWPVYKTLDYRGKNVYACKIKFRMLCMLVQKTLTASWKNLLNVLRGWNFWDSLALMETVWKNPFIKAPITSILLYSTFETAPHRLMVKWVLRVLSWNGFYNLFMEKRCIGHRCQTTKNVGFTNSVKVSGQIKSIYILVALRI